MRSSKSILCRAVLGAVLLACPSIIAAEGSARCPWGVDCQTLRREILRREAIVQNTDYAECRDLLMHLGNAEAEYKRVVGRMLGFYNQSLMEVFRDNRYALTFQSLRRRYESLRQLAEQSGLLVPPHIASRVKDRKPGTAAMPEINGIPVAAMTEDAGKAKKATDIRRQLHEIYEKWHETAREYDKAYTPEAINKLNTVLGRMHLATVGYRRQHKARKDQLRKAFLSGEYEHFLGTPKSAPFAKYRDPEYRWDADSLPGMGVKLKEAEKRRVPEKVAGPSLPVWFHVLYDRNHCDNVAKQIAEIQADSEERMLRFAQHHTALKVGDTLRGILAAPGEPIVEEFSKAWHGEQSYGDATAKGLVGFGKVLTVDMVKGVVESGERLIKKGGGAISGLATPHGQLKYVLEKGDKMLKGVKGQLRGATAELPERADFDDTAEGRRKYTEALKEYKTQARKAQDELKPMNQEFDRVLGDAMDVLNIYLAGKGVEAGGMKLVERCKARNKAHVEVKQQVQKQGELQTQCREVLADQDIGTRSRESVKAAEEFSESKAKHESAFDDFFDSSSELDIAVDRLTSQQQQRSSLGVEEVTSGGPIVKPDTPPLAKVGDTLVTGNGVKLKVGKLGELKGKEIDMASGSFGEVYGIGEYRGKKAVIKLFKKENKGRPLDPKKNQQRELGCTDQLTQRDIPAAKIIEDGVLADGTPYVIKESIPPGDILSNVERAADGKLPPDYQRAVLDLMEQTLDKDVACFDVAWDNLYTYVENGKRKAAFIEGDFIRERGDLTSKHLQNLSREDLLQLQLDQMVSLNKLRQAELHTEFNAGREAPLRDGLDMELVEVFEKKYRKKLNLEKAAARHAQASKALEDAQAGGKAGEAAAQEAAVTPDQAPDLIGDFQKAADDFGLESADLGQGGMNVADYMKANADDLAKMMRDAGL